MTSRRVKLHFKYRDVLLFVAGWLVVTAVFGRVIGDALRVYIAYYLYMIGWLLFFGVYWTISRSAPKVKRSIQLITIIAFLCLALPVWILARWDRERLIYNAARYDHPIILRMLFAKDTNQNEINQALLDAAAEGAANIVEYTLGKGASPDARLDNDDSALMVATQSGSIATVRILLGNRADVNARNKSGRTALIWAAYENTPEIARVLIDAGAEINARDEKGKTAIDLAYEFQNEELVQVLKQIRPRNSRSNP